MSKLYLTDSNGNIMDSGATGAELFTGGVIDTPVFTGSVGGQIPDYEARYGGGGADASAGVDFGGVGNAGDSWLGTIGQVATLPFTVFTSTPIRNQAASTIVASPFGRAVVSAGAAPGVGLAAAKNAAVTVVNGAKFAGIAVLLILGLAGVVLIKRVAGK